MVPVALDHLHHDSNDTAAIGINGLGCFYLGLMCSGYRLFNLIAACDSVECYRTIISTCESFLECID